MSEEVPELVRQWVSVPGGSCDVRVGRDLVEGLGSVLKTVAGRPEVCAIVVPAGSDEGLVERLRRQVTDAGFRAARVDAPSGGSARDVGALCELMAALGRAGVTSDDLVLALGDADELSLAQAACSVWCGGVPLAAVALDLAGMLLVPASPRPLDVGGREEVASFRLGIRYLFCDPLVMDLSLGSEATRLSLALMAATAVADSRPALEHLWDATPQIMGGDEDVLLEQTLSLLKARGKLASSTAVAVRQSLFYGQDFVRALRPLVPAASEAELLGEALRFSARVSAGEGKLDVDDVLVQDELLERLGIEPVECELEPGAMVEALRRERFARSNRFLLALPQAVGRVRLSSVDEGLLAEHAAAWCDAHLPEE